MRGGGRNPEMDGGVAGRAGAVGGAEKGGAPGLTADGGAGVAGEA